MVTALFHGGLFLAFLGATILDCMRPCAIQDGSIQESWILGPSILESARCATILESTWALKNLIQSKMVALKRNWKNRLLEASREGSNFHPWPLQALLGKKLAHKLWRTSIKQPQPYWAKRKSWSKVTFALMDPEVNFFFGSSLVLLYVFCLNFYLSVECMWTCF